ncbi:hypothetical protein ACCO45_005194 [Purpureocillium lilacinum]|uniref:Uncharacterized protein n=1 Tax=Purpureocillium lilacinum TaxID=33203 RepID=A0ACC4DVX4_PURLI
MSTATSSAPAKHEARLALSPTLASPGSFDLDVTECVNRTAPQASVTPPHPRSQCSLRGEAATACPVRSSLFHGYVRRAGTAPHTRRRTRSRAGTSHGLAVVLPLVYFRQLLVGD